MGECPAEESYRRKERIQTKPLTFYTGFEERSSGGKGRAP